MRLLLLCLLSFSALPGAVIPELPEHMPFTDTMTVTNPYARAVRIGVIDTSCSCDRLEIADRFLIPGETTTLSVHVDNSNRSGPASHRFWLYVTDSAYPPITLEAHWQVIPDVAVDVIPPNAPLDERPDQAYRDIYQLISSIRPDEPHRLRKVLRVWSPAELPDGLQIAVEQEPDTLWEVTTRRQDDHSLLVIARGRDDLEDLAKGAYSETITLVTNHPHKQRIELQFNTASDTEAGRLEGDNPFEALR